MSLVLVGDEQRGGPTLRRSRTPVVRRHEVGRPQSEHRSYSRGGGALCGASTGSGQPPPVVGIAQIWRSASIGGRLCRMDFRASWRRRSSRSVWPSLRVSSIREQTRACGRALARAGEQQRDPLAVARVPGHQQVPRRVQVAQAERHSRRPERAQCSHSSRAAQRPLIAAWLPEPAVRRQALLPATGLRRRHVARGSLQASTQLIPSAPIGRVPALYSEARLFRWAMTASIRSLLGGGQSVLRS
jgi:hypothetical protein